MRCTPPLTKVSAGRTQSFHFVSQKQFLRSQIDAAPLRNSEAVVQLLSMMPQMMIDIQERIIKLLAQLSKLSLRTCQTLFSAGSSSPSFAFESILPTLLRKGVAEVFLRKFTEDDPLSPAILKLIAVLGSFRCRYPSLGAI